MVPNDYQMVQIYFKIVPNDYKIIQIIPQWNSNPSPTRNCSTTFCSTTALNLLLKISGKIRRKAKILRVLFSFSMKNNGQKKNAAKETERVLIKNLLNVLVVVKFTDSLCVMLRVGTLRLNHFGTAKSPRTEERPLAFCQLQSRYCSLKQVWNPMGNLFVHFRYCFC